MSMFVLTAAVKRRLHTFSLRSLTQNMATVSWENILTKKLSNIFPFTIFFEANRDKANMANITNVPDYKRLMDTRHHQQPKGIGTPSCLASPLCTITTSWPTSPWRRKLESFSRDLEIAEGTLPKWRTSGAKPEDCPRLGLFTHPSTLGGFYSAIKTGLFTDVSKQGLSLPSKPGLTPHHPLTPPDT